MAALWLLLCALAVPAGTLAGLERSSHTDSLLEKVLQTANLQPTDLALGLLPPGRDSLRLAIVDQILAGRRADLWTDSLAREVESAQGLAAIGRTLNRATSPLYPEASSRLMPPLPHNSGPDRESLRAWIGWLRGLGELRFMADSLCVALEQDMATGEDEDDETGDVFAKDSAYRAALADKAERANRLQDARLRAHWPRLQGALADLDSLLAALPGLEQVLAGARTHRDRELGQVIYRDEFLLIGGPGPNIYRGELPPIVIDAGGDDLYDAPVAVTRGGLSLLLDLGGNDVYRSSLGPARAVGGLALLVDRAGDDQYAAGSGSLGSALGGIAVLQDLEGNDTYRGGHSCLGAGDLGWGLLLDDSGRDRYTCDSTGQGYAGSGGVGLLMDREGGDSYDVAPAKLDFIRYKDHYLSLSQGFSTGSAMDLSGGLGLLLDLQGADRYACDIYGQGAGYWYGLGALVDRSGPDVYTSWQYAQGAGIHRAIGVLLDDEGSDCYRSHGVAQGCGHDQGLGWLEDRQGEDYYLSEGLSQAAGNNNGAGVLLDHAGNDLYAVRVPGKSQGYGNPRNQTGSLGLFADGSGDDHYPAAGPPSPVWSRGIGGLGMELEPVPPATQAAPAEPLQEDITEAASLDSLFDSLDTVDRLHVWAIWSTRARHLWQAERSIAHRQLHRRQEEVFALAGPAIARGGGIRETRHQGDSDHFWVRLASVCDRHFRHGRCTNAPHLALDDVRIPGGCSGLLVPHPMAAPWSYGGHRLADSAW
jgi:hypothetical protein